MRNSLRNKNTMLLKQIFKLSTSDTNISIFKDFLPIQS
jgi:hypothetical protein